jgi:hypothetical protein
LTNDKYPTLVRYIATLETSQVSKKSKIKFETSKHRLSPFGFISTIETALAIVLAMPQQRKFALQQ